MRYLYLFLLSIIVIFITFILNEYNKTMLKSGKRVSDSAQLSPLSIECSLIDRKNLIVIFAAGQSNIGNFGETKFMPSSSNVFNFANGKCFKAQDPLLGAGGVGGNPLTILSQFLADQGHSVLIAPVAIGGTKISGWADENVYGYRITNTLKQLNAMRLRPNYILWHQGEDDAVNFKGFFSNIVQSFFYQRNLKSVIELMRQESDAPILVGLTSRCGSLEGVPDLRHVQKNITSLQGVYLGANTDILGHEYRKDDKCHFNEKGLNAAAQLWLKAIYDVSSTV